MIKAIGVNTTSKNNELEDIRIIRIVLLNHEIIQPRQEAKIIIEKR